MAVTTKKSAPKKAKSAKPAPAAKKTAAKASAINPYLMFNGNCEAAFKFYQTVFGVKADCLYRFKDMPPSEGKADAKLRNKIMHMSIQIGSMMLMGSDSCPEQPVTVGDSVILGIYPPSAAEAKRIFKALSARGKVTIALGKTFWAELHGVAIDRFGVTWMVNYTENA